jgi:hypothetical protein
LEKTIRKKLAGKELKSMAAKKESESKGNRSRRPPATTPEARENQLISSAVDLAEKQMQEGTASAQVITHYLKLGSSREKLEQERMRQEVALMEAKRENMASAARVEELYGAAIDAMRAYAGHEALHQKSEEEEVFDE